MRLTRKPGADIFASIGLANPWAETRHDPNGYYDRLGLSKDFPWLMNDIKTAYRKRSRELHPDFGGDSKEFNRVTVAYSVLSNPETRREYDALSFGAVWPDDEVILEVLNTVRLIAKEKEGTEEMAVNSKDTASNQESSSSLTKTILNWMEYGYEDDPSNLEREDKQSWIDLFIKVFWDMGFRHEIIRIGFCSIPSHIVSRSWGDIFMLSGSPNEQVVRELVSQAKKFGENGTSPESVG